jgi:hypothetical protein
MAAKKKSPPAWIRESYLAIAPKKIAALLAP